MNGALSEEYLGELRAAYAGVDSPEAEVIVGLLGEVARLRGLVEPRSASASVSKTTSGKWAVRWRENGRQRSRTFERRRDAEHFRADMRGRWNGGAR
nr:hypothetical protein KPHV_60200 [Kitasatospora purpeofusca]